MTVRYDKQQVILAKLEVTPGVDPVPTGGANAILVVNPSSSPTEGEEVRRDLALPNLGHQGVYITGVYGEVTFEVELAGSGTAGTPPAYAPLLKACGMAETVTAVTKVEYTPLPIGTYPTVTIYYHKGGIRRRLLMARGTVVFTLNAKGIPRMRFTFRGLVTPTTDVAVPAADFAAFRPPVVVDAANTTLTLHGLTALGQSLTLDVGATIAKRDQMSQESIELTDRMSVGSATIQAGLAAEKDWDGIYRAGTRGALLCTHGTLAGNIVEISAPSVQIGKPSEGQTDNITNVTLPLMYGFVNGNDEWKITVR